MTKFMPKVSVIIPNYNHARFLRQRIDTVLQQTYQDLEVVLMDDCSSDKSRSIISEYAGDSRVRIEFNEKNSGSTFRQWNKGVRLARGQYVWIAESDDYADERLVERLIDLLLRDSSTVFAYCRSLEIAGEDQEHDFADAYLSGLDRWSKDFHVDGRDECQNWFVRTNPVPNASAVLFRKKIYEQVGGADESLRLCGDWKLWAAMAMEGSVAYVGEALNYHRWHDASMRSEAIRSGLNVSEALGVIRWILDRVKPTPTVSNSMREFTSSYWVPAVLNRRVPLDRRRAILRAAMAIDPHALRRLIRPGLASVRLKIGLELRHLRQRFAGRAS
jgi:glycosyltransferase involved in cell wall biosynthesis